MPAELSELLSALTFQRFVSHVGRIKNCHWISM